MCRMPAPSHPCWHSLTLRMAEILTRTAYTMRAIVIAAICLAAIACAELTPEDSMVTDDFKARSSLMAPSNAKCTGPCVRIIAGA